MSPLNSPKDSHKVLIFLMNFDRDNIHQNSLQTMGGWFLDPTNLIRAESFQIRLSLSSGKQAGNKQGER